MEFAEDTPSSPLDRPTIGEVIGARYGRRDVLRGALAMTAVATLTAKTGGLVGSQAEAAETSGAGSVPESAWSFQFPELEAAVDETHHVAEGYDADILIRWGDPVAPGAPAFDPMHQTAEAQEQQFGYNNDFIGFVPLPAGSDSADHGLLCINHEYTNEELMFPNYEQPTAETVAIEMAAHGHSVIEVQRGRDGKWSYRKDSPYNRRYSLRSTEMAISGPAAGHPRLQTSHDSSGTRVIGTVNNCAGGVTPWNTVLIAEENFHGYFKGENADPAEAQNHTRYGVPGGWYAWADFDDRFDIGKEPHEPNRFGWMVEYDPYDPSFTPVKRTAMGRFKHEGAETIENKDGRVVSVMGDDQRFDYVYKFVSYGRVDHNNRTNNFGLLDSGTLYVARFNEDGTVDWLPIVYGTGPLTPENGFNSQADVLIETRRAADLLGATPMDRPEDVAPDAQEGKIYVMLTSNEKRKPDATHPANPRAGNSAGHVLEIDVTDGDFAGLQDRWDILVLAGDPNDPNAGAQWGKGTSQHGWFVNPDNAVVDHRGRLWISTDGNDQETSGRADGVWAIETKGDLRGSSRHFFRCPVGAEMCGPFFTPDDGTLFVAVQHPGDAEGSTFENPVTRWPDFDDNLPVRPAVVAITRNEGGQIG
ncbi:DUF839 domain-containing protein [Rhodovibrio salinarum]|uniref:DUF839 domain-containing protein n=2 Tax=Rhodovibrio salinarum TaxID=1087 RepID=A0A934V1Q5_9PROT|nr:PhoX family phosphatase [Rhodovibrio salinarum]MBK1698755.1 DUF839 domain-containing protein [Rhodovibrio salinarum]